MKVAMSEGRKLDHLEQANLGSGLKSKLGESFGPLGSRLGVHMKTLMQAVLKPSLLNADDLVNKGIPLTKLNYEYDVRVHVFRPHFFHFCCVPLPPINESLLSFSTLTRKKK